ncbi:threonine-phosphate decarboxylase CobD [Billgrantia aerodenitrificans]|uniref:threonine-phosphate decarboxylase n=1 Tax=Billgrantia aerodenitrificans TaxID=2733483 RepID=A0ABS9AP60_9GAMM|nr:threonine-phosphate decarboxylase CobD [Halomonas aerodenitrificans]MCE8023493.1 threonine-phosphate decarboxylase [Halomonas aerodenitrificans]
MSDWPSHGGRPEQLLPRFGLAGGSEVIDFSANLNPLGPPTWLAERLAASVAELATYPDPDYREACEAIARAEELPAEQVRLTNGGAEAIFLAAALLARQGVSRAAIVQPTFGEYTRACRHYGIAVEHVELAGERFELDEARAAEAMRAAGALFLCRPNNPTGTLIERERIERLLAAAQRHGATLVVDEAFVDFVTPDERLTPLLARFDNLLLLRSMTKLYAIPGLRLGYLLGSATVVGRIGELQPPWSVNALAAGLVAPLLADRDYLARTRAWLDAERPWLHAELEALGLDVVPSHANFLLFRDAHGESMPALLEHLARCGILARHTHNFIGLEGAWLRVAVRSRKENAQLVEAITRWRNP